MQKQILANDGYILNIAEIKDSETIHNLMKRVYNNLGNKDLFVCDSLEFIKEHILNSGFCVKACDANGELAGYLIVRYPGMQDDNLGLDIGLGKGELCRVVHMESVAVREESRGCGLQYRMLKFAEECIDKNRYSYFMATVSPDNMPSKSTFLKCGYEVVATKEKYGGMTRDILSREGKSLRI